VYGVEPRAEASINDFAIACLRKISMMGAVSQKVGFACVQALGEMGSNEAISQLARLRTKVKYTVALRLIEKCLREAAERSGLTVDQLEDVAAPSYAIDAEGKAEIAVGDCDATIHLCGDGEVGIMWRNAEGRPVKTAPSYIKAAFPKEAGVLRSGTSPTFAVADMFRLFCNEFYC